MNTEELNKLLDKYYEGLTSEEEEKFLMDFIRNYDAGEDFEAEKEIFLYYSGKLNIPEPSAGFEEKIIRSVHKEKILPETGRKLIISVISVAASVLIMIGSYFFFTGRKEPKDTFSDPEIAYNAAINVLYDVSIRMNQGMKTLEPLGKIVEIGNESFAAINRSRTVVEKEIKNLDLIRETIGITGFNLNSTEN